MKENKMFCTNCGRKLPDNISYCPFCGAKAYSEAAGDAAVIDEPAAEAHAAHEPAAEESAAEAPVTQESAAEAPVTQEPATESPAAQEPDAEEPAAETPVTLEPSTAETPAAAAVIAEDTPAEPAKKKKTGLIAAIIAVLIIALGVGGYFIYQNLPSTKLAKLRTQIAAAIEIKDYSGAISLIEQAGEFAPQDKELRRQYVGCREAMILNKYKLLEYEEFIAEADELIKDYPEAAEVLEPLVKESYEDMARDAIGDLDVSAMKSIKDRLADLTNAGRFNFSGIISELEDKIQHTELTTLFQSLADKLLPLIKSGNRTAVFDAIHNEFISSRGSARKLVPSKAAVEYHYPLFSKADKDGKRLGIYHNNGHYFFYYGDYNGNLREGYGIWICADNLKTDNSYRDYWAEGPWSVGRPNGTFTITNLSKYANTDAEQLVQGTAEISSGLYNGKVVFTYDNSKPLTGNYTHGLPKVIMTTDPNGKKANVVMISEDGNAWISSTNISSPQGLYGCY